MEVTSGMVMRPLHTLLMPPWKATLNMVFLARLKEKLSACG